MKKNYGVRILSFGGALPSKVVTNSELEKLFETSDEWIYTRTGIKERRIISGDESGLSLSYDAAKEAIDKAKINPDKIDLIIVATSTPDMLYPSMSCMLQGKLGASNAVCFDISAACSGFVFGLVTAAQYIYSGTYNNILLIGVDIHSRFVDWKDRSVAILFGDGAGAMLLSSCTPEEDQLLGYKIKSSSDISSALTLSNKNASYENFNGSKEFNFVKMNGKAIYQFAVKSVPEVLVELMESISLDSSKIDYLVLHQANQRIIESAADKLGFKPLQVISNIKGVGNTSAASIPLALLEGLKSKNIKLPCTIALVGFGAGLTWGSAIIKLE